MGSRQYRITVFVVLLFSGLGTAMAQEYSTNISPAWFGPNAFQVPQMNDAAKTSSNLTALLAGDYIAGRTGEKDNTADIYLELHIPLFTDRVNLSVWGALHEWYNQSDDVLRYRGIPTGEGLGKGDKSGTLFLSTDIQVVKEKQYCPSFLLRLGLRTASENMSFPAKRGYDCAGYFFDLNLGKSFGAFGVAASTGFLCWQTGMGEQNDAIQFGVKANYANPDILRAGVQYGGYYGWRKDGDFPRVLYLHMDFGPQKWYVKPYFLYQHGFHDWPFDLFRLGIKADIDVLGLTRKH